MQKAIKVHCQHCAVWFVVPIKSRPQTVVKAFQQLQTENNEAARAWAWETIQNNTDEPFSTFNRNFEGGGYYKNGIPQAREIHDDGEDRYEIIGNFSEYIC